MNHLSFNLKFKLGALALCLSLSALSVSRADSEFNTAFLDAKNSDASSLDAVINGYAMQAGKYNFSIILNKEHIDDRLISFVENHTTQQVEPCLDRQFLQDYGVIFSEEKIQAQQCIDLPALIEHASLSFDAGYQELNLSIPQVNLEYRPKGFIAKSMYDEGINAALLNYTLSGNYNHNQNYADQHHVNILLNGGFNFGAWRYRNSSNYSLQTGGVRDWHSTSNRLERNIVNWHSRLVLGDAASGSDLFDSINFRGLRLASDAQQLAYSLQNYAPVVRGSASSNATVEIRQNGFLIYSMNVAPGAFEIRDLVSANESGDLYVKVIESDGRSREFVQPYSAVPTMLRPKQWRYELLSGRFRSGNDAAQDAPYFAQATMGYGINNDYTPYVGVLVAENYAAAGLGLALSLGRWGALSSDIIYAKTQLASGGNSDGTSIKFLYSKSLNRFGSSVKILGYRYSTQGYYDFADAVAEQSQWRDNRYEYAYETMDNRRIDGQLMPEVQRSYAYSSRYYNKKNQLQLAFSQRLGNVGQVFANWSNISYWNGGLNQQSWQLGYMTQIKDAALSMYYQKSKSQFNPDDYTLGLTLSIPLDAKRKHSNNITSSTSVQYSPSTGSDVQTGLSASVLKDRNLQLGLQSNLSTDSVSLNASYQGNRADVDMSYSYQKDYQQIAANISGGVLVHSGGVLLGQQLSSTPIIVEAKGATGVRIENQAGLAINPQGYAIIRASNAYRRNRVALRAEDLGSNISIDQAVQQDIVPTKDAIVKVTFDVSHGQNVLAKITTADQQEMQFGALVFNRKQKQVGIVATDGQAFITGVSSGEALSVRWGEASDEQCQMEIPRIDAKDLGYSEVSLVCQ